MKYFRATTNRALSFGFGILHDLLYSRTHIFNEAQGDSFTCVKVSYCQMYAK